ncbi:hypothetical protein [uncultured Flavobacterium sp.]|jgi:hypothetical protein|uniref:hypothetical protein n=1 Tax=uncultured Flavobacterium sp. TaxID=165435 RepID=UPI002593D921|nr:hypothetical protein [uncultured Flavobacterium sp.]
MRQKIRFSLFFLSIGFLFLLSSCEKDLYEEGINQKRLKISHVNFNDLLKDQKFSKAYNKVQAQKNNAAKTVMEEQYQFTIANKPVKVVETESATSYTILINREIDDVNSFENLIVQQLNSGETIANIIKYVPFQPATIESYFLNGDFNGNRTVTTIVYNDNLINSTNKITNICSTVCTTLCYDCKPNYSSEYQTPHTPGANCPTNSISTSCEQVCVTYDDGGGSSSNPIDITGGGGTGGSTDNLDPPHNDSGNNPIVTAPVLELGEEEEVITPCENLKNLFSPTITPSVKTVIQTQLQPNILINPYGEKGAKLQRTPNGTIGVSIIPSTTVGCIGIPVGGNNYIAIHTHPVDNSQPMFSWSDVYTLYVMNKEIATHNSGMASFLLVCQDSSGNFLTYAIVIENIGNTVESVLNDPEFAGMEHEDIKKIMDKKLYKDYNIEQNSAVSTNYEKAFLKFMQSSNISLYKANNTLTNWSKLSLGGLNTDTVTPSPCK